MVRELDHRARAEGVSVAQIQKHPPWSGWHAVALTLVLAAVGSSFVGCATGSCPPPLSCPAAFNLNAWCADSHRCTSNGTVSPGCTDSQCAHLAIGQSTMGPTVLVIPLDEVGGRGAGRPDLLVHLDHEARLDVAFDGVPAICTTTVGFGTQCQTPAGAARLEIAVTANVDAVRCGVELRDLRCELDQLSHDCPR